MGQAIDIVAQFTMDAYYRDFKGAADFFDLDDFIFRCGATAAEFYRQEFAAKYGELKAERSDSLVAFGDDLLASKTIKVTSDPTGAYAEIDFPVLSFSYDTKNAGLQSVFSHGVEVERSSMTERWQLAQLPYTNKTFWWLEGKRIKFFTKGYSNVDDITVYYVPGIGHDMIIPDGIIDHVINTTVMAMKQIEQGMVVKATNDGNPNKIIETEINKTAMK